MSNKNGENKHLSGIARLEAAMFCSGFFVGAPEHPDAPAYLITSGHCVQNWEALGASLETQREQAVSMAWTASFQLFRDTPERVLKVPVKKIMFSTMRGIDLAVLELGQNAAALLRAGIKPLPLSAAPPAPGTAIHIVGVPELPAAATAPAELPFMRSHPCAQEDRHDIVEWIWYWPQLFANRCLDIEGGSSGSPLLDASQKAFAIVSTSTRGAKAEPCGLGHPCEVKDKAKNVQAAPDTNYAVSLEGLAGCFSTKGVFDAKREACALPRQRPYKVSRLLNYPSRSVNEQGMPVGWNLKFEGKGSFRILTGMLGAVNCRNPQAYGAAQNLSQLQLGMLPRADGIYLLCWLEGEEKEPTVVVARVDNTGPVKKPRLQIDTLPEGLNIYLLEEPPELSRFQLGWGSLEEACSSIQKRAETVPSMSFDRQQLPLRICYRGEDVAGNPGPWLEQIIGKPGRAGKKPASTPKPRKASTPR